MSHESKSQPSLSVPARPNHIFVDFENVHEVDLSRIKTDQIFLIVVLGAKQTSLPIYFTEFLQTHPKQLKLVKTPASGKNALDFVLSVEVGLLLAHEPGSYVHIISKDKGFDAMIAHLKEKKFRVARHISLSDVPILANADEKLQRLISHLKDPTKTRPGKKSTLENTIRQHFDKSLTPETIEKTINHLVHAKVVTISETGAVTYHNSPKLTVAA